MTPASIDPRPIALVGLPGAGKTTLGRRLSEHLGWELRDTDREIEHRTGRTPAQILDMDGEDTFRRVELAAVTELLGEPGPAVIACGGGLFAEAGARRQLLEAAWVVALDASDSTLMNRLGTAADRPLLRGDVGGRLADLRRRRARAHAEAHLLIDTESTSPEAAEAAIRALAGAVPVPIGGSAYPVIVAEGATDHLTTHLPADCRRVAVVADRSVEPLGRRLARRLATSGREAPLVSIAAGEPVKSWAAAGRLLDRLASLGLGRRDALVAVGGGTVGDLAGFAAAAYCRGIAWVVVPTTLLAMVDSSIGGKTGVNLRAAKNLAGAFWQPRAVLADPTVLDTLPPRELASGLGEVAKYAMIAETDLPDLLDHGLERARTGDVRTLTAIIDCCAAIKAQVVGRDPRESGLRAVLNYGHTVAHALEAATGYGTVTHGEAVAAGMRVAGRLSAELAGLPAADLAWQDRVLDRLGLEGLPPIDPVAVMHRLGHDKKSVGGEVRWVLLARRGEPLLDQRVPADLVRSTLEEVLSTP
ncbi:MAG: 3-dehydroquinate synthase [Candidatus Dormibacteria bacterium]